MIKTAKPLNSTNPVSPPARFAQLPDQGIPMIGNDNGFAAREKSADDNPLAPVNQAAKRAQTATQQFGSDLNNKVNDLLDDANQSIKQPLDNLLNKSPTSNEQSTGSPFAGNRFDAVQTQPQPNNLQANLPEISNNPAPTMQSPSPRPSQSFNSRPNLSVPSTGAPSNATPTSENRLGTGT